MSLIRPMARLGHFINNQRPCQSFSCCDSKLGLFRSNCRTYAASNEEGASAVEKMQQILQERFPKAKKIAVNDLSGGCGSMYEIFVETVEFKGLPLVKQHMLINQILKDQIKSMHGLTVKTKIADAEGS